MKLKAKDLNRLRKIYQQIDDTHAGITEQLARVGEQTRSFWNEIRELSGSTRVISVDWETGEVKESGE